MNDGETADLKVEFKVGTAAFSASGSPDLVFTALDRFEALLAARPTTGSSTEPPAASDDGRRYDKTSTSGSVTDGNENGTPSTSTNGSSSTSADEKLPLKVFLKQKKLPRGNPGIALGVVVWATRFESATDLDLETIHKYWNRSGEKWPANPVRDIRRAVTEGWLDEPSDRVFRLNGFGESTWDDLEAGSR